MVIQATLTELQDDEAYYWVYSKFLSWGYFDHPPMTALLIKGGTALSGGEFGVRIFFIVLNLLTLLMMEKLMEKRSPFLFYAIALSLSVLQLAGYFAVPDTPLIFFTALFFWTYKQFVSRSSWRNTLWMALATVLLFYTKYHAILIIFFTLLSNMKLLSRGRTYIAGLIVLILFFPHLYWQWQHDWVSIQYHLFESNVDPYKFSYTTEYILGQLLLAGPLVGVILMPAALIFKSTTYTERAMKFTLTGIYLFFFLSSFRGKVEPNWTSPAIIPLVVLAHQSLLQKRASLKWLIRLTPFSIIIILFARIVMIVDVVPLKMVEARFHAWERWPAELKIKTHGLPVVLSNSYQRASKYWFYSGQITYSQNHVRDHRNNYNFWPIEERLLGQPVYFMDTYSLERFPDKISTGIGTIGYRYDSICTSMAMIQFIPLRSLHWKYSITSGDSLIIPVKITMPDNYASFIRSHPVINSRIKIFILDHKTILEQIVLPYDLKDLLNDELQIKVRPSVPPGEHEIIFSIEAEGYNPTHNSERIKLTVH
jgi:hypothetical protein